MSLLPLSNPFLSRLQNMAVVSSTDTTDFVSYGGQIVPEYVAYLLFIAADAVKAPDKTLDEQRAFFNQMKPLAAGYTVPIYSVDDGIFEELNNVTSVTFKIAEDGMLTWIRNMMAVEKPKLTTPTTNTEPAQQQQPTTTTTKTPIVTPYNPTSKIYYKPSCIHSPTWVFKDPHTDIAWYAASRSDLWDSKTLSYDRTMCIISLETVSAPSITGNHDVSHLCNLLPYMIRIEWADYTAPIYSRTFYEHVIKHVRELGVANVVVHCMAGHGRTGSFLAIVAGIFNIDADPINYIRNIHCLSAVENEKQQDYVVRILSK